MPIQTQEQTQEIIQEQTQEQLHNLPVDSLKRDVSQPRQVIDNDRLLGMAASMKTEGVINPIEVDQDNIIVTGEMRWRAAKIAGLKTIPCKIITIDAEHRFLRQVIENIHHNTMTEWDTAVAFRKLIARMVIGHEHGGGQVDRGISQLSRQIGKSTSYIRERLDLLDYSPKIKAAVRSGKINFTQIRALRKVPKVYRNKMEKKILSENFSSRDIALEVAAAVQRAPDTKKAREILNIDYRPYKTTADVITKLSTIVPRFSDVLRESYTPPKELAAIKNALLEWLNKYPKTTMAPVHASRIALTFQVISEAMMNWTIDRKALDDKH